MVGCPPYIPRVLERIGYDPGLDRWGAAADATGVSDAIAADFRRCGESPGRGRMRNYRSRLGGALLRLHSEDSGIPYGVALAIGALVIYPETDWIKAVDLARFAAH